MQIFPGPPSVVNFLIKSLLIIFHRSGQTEFQLSFCLSNFQSRWPNNILVHFPSCLLPKAIKSLFLPWLLGKAPCSARPAFFPPGPLWLVFWQIGMGCSCAFKISFLKCVQSSWIPLLLKTVSQGTLNHCPELAKLCPLAGQGRPLVDALSSLPKNWKLSFCGDSAQDSLWPHHPQSFSSHKQKAPWGLPLLAHTHHLCKEIVFHTIQEPPRMPLLYCAEFPAEIQRVKAKSPTITRSWDILKLLVECFVWLFVLVGWSWKGSHQDICLVGHHLDSYSSWVKFTTLLSLSSIQLKHSLLYKVTPPPLLTGQSMRPKMYFGRHLKCAFFSSSGIQDTYMSIVHTQIVN